MNLNLITEAELAEQLRVSPEQVRRLRWRHKWPHLGVGQHVRYTEAQVEAILSLLAYEPRASRSVPAIDGQTTLSARRSA